MSVVAGVVLLVLVSRAFRTAVAFSAVIAVTWLASVVLKVVVDRHGPHWGRLWALAMAPTARLAVADLVLARFGTPRAEKARGCTQAAVAGGPLSGTEAWVERPSG
ncbi:hypothetical protein [Arthrobacter sp. NyZ413]|uniref:hypothetical protein n=1 Tax=Arthrobacter sp. NyZ413 TaxID=3144669 RepID=UPI003BF84BA3